MEKRRSPPDAGRSYETLRRGRRTCFPGDKPTVFNPRWIRGREKRRDSDLAGKLHADPKS